MKWRECIVLLLAPFRSIFITDTSLQVEWSDRTSRSLKYFPTKFKLFPQFFALEHLKLSEQETI